MGGKLSVCPQFPKKDRYQLLFNFITPRATPGSFIAAMAILASFLVPEARRVFSLERRTTGATPVTSPVTNPVPPPKIEGKVIGVSTNSVEELRKRNNVIRMKETESGKPLTEVPP